MWLIPSKLIPRGGKNRTIDRNRKERDVSDLSQTGQWVLADWRGKCVFFLHRAFLIIKLARCEDFGFWQAERQNLHVTAVLSEVKNSHERAGVLQKSPHFLGKKVCPRKGNACLLSKHNWDSTKIKMTGAKKAIEKYKAFCSYSYPDQADTLHETQASHQKIPGSFPASRGLSRCLVVRDLC